MKVASGVLVAILVVTLGISIFAQGPRQGGFRQPPFPPPPRPPQQGGPRGASPQDLRSIEDALKLSSTQTERIRGLIDARVKSEETGQDEVRSKLDAIAALQRQPSPNQKELNAAMQALRQARQAGQATNAQFKADFLAVLTSEQKKTLDDLNAVAAPVVALSRLGILENVEGGPPLPPGPQRGQGRGRGRLPPGPLGFMPVPPSNPMTAEKVQLGRQLFFDKRLSADGSLACVSCHDPERAFSDGRAVARGIKGAEGDRNSPALINAGFSRSFFWDGRANTLEEQVLAPMLNPKELGLKNEKDIEHKAGRPVKEITDALATYVRTIRSVESRFDWYSSGQTGMLNDLEEAGLDLFRGRAQCITCHGGPNLTDDRFHNTGVAWRNGRLADDGRFIVSKNERDRGAFKTPTLRDVARTAPYMHDGTLTTLEEVVDFYSDGGRRNPTLDPRIRPLNLSPGEKLAIVAFLRTLNGRVIEGL